MKLLDQTFDGQQYTVRIWRDEVSSDAVDTYNWPRFSGKDKAAKETYEAQQIDQALALSSLQVPPAADPVVITKDDGAIADLQAAVEPVEVVDVLEASTDTSSNN